MENLSLVVIGLFQITITITTIENYKKRKSMQLVSSSSEGGTDYQKRKSTKTKNTTTFGLKLATARVTSTNFNQKKVTRVDIVY